jgi:O-methyltransferase domain
MPEYFEKYGKKEPQTMNHVPATYAYGHPEWSFYEMIAHDPPRMMRFFKAMGPIEARMPIAGIYDFGWLVAKAEAEPTSDRPLFVDVGGGRGQAIVAIRKEFPGLLLPRCVLQDRPEVIEQGKATDDPELRGVQRMAIDFHTEQPVKGSSVLFMHVFLPSITADGRKQERWCIGSVAVCTTTVTM